MEKQLNMLRDILGREIAWYSQPPNDRESIYVHFTQASDNKKIDDMDWVSWVFKYQEILGPVIKQIFEQAFPGKEFSVQIGSAFGGTRDYLSVGGKSLTLQDILATPQRLAEQEQFQKNMHRFFEIVLEKVRVCRLAGSEKIICAGTDDVFEDEMFGKLTYLEWWLGLIEQKPSLGRFLNTADFLLGALATEIAQRFPGESFMTEISQEDKTFSIIFDTQDDA